MRYYDKENNRLIYVGIKSNKKYWENHWNDDEFERKVKISSNGFISNNTQKYLPRGSKILEGGCGRGQNVYLLNNIGYECIGIEYAQEIVKK